MCVCVYVYANLHASVCKHLDWEIPSDWLHLLVFVVGFFFSCWRDRQRISVSRRWRPIQLNVLLPLTSTSLSLPLPHSFPTSHPTPGSPLGSGLTAETAARPANTLQLASCASVHPKPLADEVQSIGFNYNFLRNASNLSKSFDLSGVCSLTTCGR